MEKIILYVDDAIYASQYLTQHAVPSPAHWIVVGCAPRMTQRVSKWVSRSARTQWRTKWLAKQMEGLAPQLQGASEVTALLATRPLTELTRQLQLQYGTAQVIDARRPKLGVELEPVAPDVPAPAHSNWTLPGAVAGMGALLVLANELSE